ncbi:thermostable hemolysin [Pseudomonadota bacterium]
MQQIAINSTKVVNLPRLVEPQSLLSFKTLADDITARLPLEFFIQQVFKQAYEAQINTFYPELISITRADQSFAAVAGFRSASSALFAEHYLEQPIESLLEQYDPAIERSGIVEVGNLAPASAGQARWLIAALTTFLYSAGFTWVVFTAVPALHNAFSRMGMPLTTLAKADRHCLTPNIQDDWGHYYDANPMVYAGKIQTGYETLNQLISPKMPRLQALWLQAQRDGRNHAQRMNDHQHYTAAALP